MKKFVSGQSVKVNCTTNLAQVILEDVDAER